MNCCHICNLGRYGKQAELRSSPSTQLWGKLALYWQIPGAQRQEFWQWSVLPSATARPAEGWVQTKPHYHDHVNMCSSRFVSSVKLRSACLKEYSASIDYNSCPHLQCLTLAAMQGWSSQICLFTNLCNHAEVLHLQPQVACDAPNHDGPQESSAACMIQLCRIT